jgi:hypothetical protein
MSKDDYEYDYDDDGNEIRIRITREMLKARLKAAEVSREKAIKDSVKARQQLAAMKRRQDNAYWCDRLKTVLDDGRIYTTNASVEVKTDYMDVTGMFESGAVSIPGAATAYLHVTFTGDEALVRFGNFLKETR